MNPQDTKNKIRTREDDIEELVQGVLDVSSVYKMRPHAIDLYVCPFCDEGSYESSMDSINHEQYCPYLIAKDLSTKR